MELVKTNKKLPLYFAAPVYWYADVIKSSNLYIIEEENFQKQTLRNRMNYGTFQGRKTFSIPITNASKKGTYKEIMLDNTQNWQKQLIHALQTSYGKSPFFEFYGYRFENLILSNYEYLWNLNIAILEETLNCLKIESVIELQKESEPIITSQSKYEPYYQVFNHKIEFLPQLSILDLIYNEGPGATEILIKQYELNNYAT